MKENKTQLLMSAAIAGIIGTGSQFVATTPAFADDAKGHCVGANACKGKGGCSMPGQNDCSGKNGCKGKGFLEITKAECDKRTKKNKKIHFESTEKKDG